MRAQQWTLPNFDKDQDDHETITAETAMETTAYKWSVCQHLPPWLCRTKRDPQTEALLRMIQALQTAATSYTGAEIENIQVVFPAKPPALLRRSVETAFSRLSLRQASWSGRPAGHLVYGTIHAGDLAYFPGPDGPFDQCVSRLVLAMDYSHAALTMNLLSDDCGLYGALRSAHYTNLGKRKLDANSREMMVAAVKDIARVPVESPFEDGVVLPQLTELVVLGEEGGDELLQGVLREALREVAATPEDDITLRAGSDFLDPLFAGAIAAARNSRPADYELDDVKAELR